MYKDYNMNQITLPLDLEVIISEDDVAMAVNELVESIPDTEFQSFEHTFGATSYHPRMMMKLILCGYVQSVTSGRIGDWREAAECIKGALLGWKSILH